MDLLKKLTRFNLFIIIFFSFFILCSIFKGKNDDLEQKNVTKVPIDTASAKIKKPKSKKERPDSTNNGTKYEYNQNTDVEQILDSVSYLTNWENISSLSRDEKIERISTELANLFDNLPQNMPEHRLLDMAWRNESQTMNNEWMEDLFQYQEDFSSSYERYNSIRGQIDRISSDIENKRNIIRSNEEQIGRLREQIENIETWQRIERESFKSQLENIPYCMLLVGRKHCPDLFNYSNSQIEDNINRITEIISDEAIRIVNGQRILNIQAIQNYEELENYIATIYEGRVLIRDKLNPPIIETNPERRYINVIALIEVYPFSRSTNSSYNVAENSEQGGTFQLQTNSVSIYEIRNNFYLDNLNNSSENLTFEDVGFTGAAIREFINSQQEILNRVNERVIPRIEEIRENHNNRIRQYNNRISQIEEEISRYNDQIESERNEINEMESQLINLQNEMTNSLLEYKDNREDYRGYVQNKLTYTNKKISRYITNWGQINFFEEAARQSVSIIDDLQEYSQRTVIFYENTIGENIELNTREITYEPHINQFQVLYIRLFENNYIYLNIAFEINWSYIDNGNGNGNGHVVNVINNYNINGNSRPVIVDSTCSQIWWYCGELQSSFTMNENGPNQFRIPSPNELFHLYRIRGNYFNNLNWETNYPFLTDSTTTDENNNTVFICHDFETHRLVRKGRGESFYIIWVKDF